MEYAKMNGLNRDVSRIGLGTWAIGGFMWGGTDEHEALETIRTALDHGISLIDTAPVYGLGRAERVRRSSLGEIWETGRSDHCDKGGVGVARTKCFATRLERGS